MKYQTEQEDFWAGDFGDAYIGRNRGEEAIAGTLDLFSKALRMARRPCSCLEFGANVGLNLQALQLLYPRQEQFGIEINASAARHLAEVITPDHVMRHSILEYEPRRTFDLVLIKGVLIHLNPDALPSVYDKLCKSVGRYLLVCEYYNPTPVAVSYRGHPDKLFKRDFAGEIMDRHPELALLDYGFVYRRDPNFPQDDLTWFLMEKRG